MTHKITVYDIFLCICILKNIHTRIAPRTVLLNVVINLASPRGFCPTLPFAARIPRSVMLSCRPRRQRQERLVNGQTKRNVSQLTAWYLLATTTRENDRHAADIIIQSVKKIKKMQMICIQPVVRTGLSETGMHSCRQSDVFMTFSRDIISRLRRHTACAYTTD